ncbi:Peptidase M50 [Sesbania bispinosa]|nr:Peptidase M50 [Sesbania bispinosa]
MPLRSMISLTKSVMNTQWFTVEFGPILAKFNAKNVEYSIRAFPLGGFVGFPDNDPESYILVDDENLLKNRPILDRIIVVLAGVIANATISSVEVRPNVKFAKVRPKKSAESSECIIMHRNSQHLNYVQAGTQIWEFEPSGKQVTNWAIVQATKFLLKSEVLGAEYLVEQM